MLLLVTNEEVDLTKFSVFMAEPFIEETSLQGTRCHVQWYYFVNDSTFICEWLILFVLVELVDVINFDSNLHFENRTISKVVMKLCQEVIFILFKPWMKTDLSINNVNVCCWSVVSSVLVLGCHYSLQNCFISLFGKVHKFYFISGPIMFSQINS